MLTLPILMRARLEDLQRLARSVGLVVVEGETAGRLALRLLPRLEASC